MAEQTEVRVEVELTRKDVVGLNFAMLRQNGSLYVIPVFGLIQLGRLIVLLRDGEPILDHLFALLFVLLLMTLPVMVYIAAKRSFDNKFLQEKKTYTFTEEGFHSTSASTSVTTQWSDIRKVVLTRDAYLLFVASNAAHILPLRDLAGTPEIPEMIRRLVPPKSWKQGRSRIGRSLLVYLLIFVVTVAIVQFFISKTP